MTKDFLKGLDEIRIHNKFAFIDRSVDHDFIRRSLSHSGTVAVNHSKPVSSSRHNQVHYGQISSADNEDIPVYAKTFYQRDMLDFFKGLVKPHRAVRAAMADRSLAAEGFTTPQLLVFGYTRKLGLKTNYYLITHALTGYHDLYQLAESFCALRRNQQVQIVKQLATAIGNLHKAGFFHGDLRPGNVLVSTDAKGITDTAFLDNERTVRFQTLPLKLRTKNLVQLNMLLSPHIRAWHRRLFFDVYCRVTRPADSEQLLADVSALTRERLLILVEKGRLRAEEINW